MKLVKCNTKYYLLGYNPKIGDEIIILSDSGILRTTYGDRHCKNSKNEDIYYNGDFVKNCYNIISGNINEDNIEKLLNSYTKEDISDALGYGYHTAKDELRGEISQGYGGRFFDILQKKKEYLKKKEIFDVEIEMEFKAINHSAGLTLTGHPLMDIAILQNYVIKTDDNGYIIIKSLK